MTFEEYVRSNRKMVNVIALSGFKGSGKDTVASYLEAVLESKQTCINYVYTLSMAAPIREFVNYTLNIAEPEYDEKDKPYTEYAYEGTTDPEYFKGQIAFWGKRLKFRTYRELINLIGTGMRKQFSDTFWIDMCEDRMNSIINMVMTNCYRNDILYQKYSQNRNIYFIIPDIRYSKELKFLNRLKNTIGYNVQYWCIFRKSALPEWTKYGLDVRDPAQLAIIEKDFKPSPHEFEWCKANPIFNKVLTNDGAKEELYAQIDNIIKTW